VCVCVCTCYWYPIAAAVYVLIVIDVMFTTHWKRATLFVMYMSFVYNIIYFYHNISRFRGRERRSGDNSVAEKLVMINHLTAEGKMGGGSSCHRVCVCVCVCVCNLGRGRQITHWITIICQLLLHDRHRRCVLDNIAASSSTVLPVQDASVHNCACVRVFMCMPRYRMRVHVRANRTR